MKKVLVSGGAGFIGSHLCTRLIRDGHKVICLDNLFTGSEKNIYNPQNHPNNFSKRNGSVFFGLSKRNGSV